MENIDLQMGMDMKAWQNPYSFAHEYSGWMNYQSSKAILDVMDENIMKCS